MNTTNNKSRAIRLILSILLCFAMLFCFASCIVLVPPESDMPFGVFDVEFHKTTYLQEESVNVTIKMGLEDGYETYPETHPYVENYLVRLVVAKGGNLPHDESSWIILKELGLDPTIYDYKMKNKEIIYNYAEKFTIPKEVYSGDEGYFVISLVVSARGAATYCSEEFHYYSTKDGITFTKTDK